MLTGFPRTRWPQLRFSESYVVRISVKISRICEFCLIMGIMTSLLGCCSSSTLGSRANDYIIRPAPSGAGRTTPSQPGHNPLNLTDPAVCNPPLMPANSSPAFTLKQDIVVWWNIFNPLNDHWATKCRSSFAIFTQLPQKQWYGTGCTSWADYDVYLQDVHIYI